MTHLSLNSYQWLETLVEDHFNLYFSIAWKILHDSHAAEDAVSESVLKAYRKASAMEDTSKAKSWLAMIVRNTALDMLRKRKRTIVMQDVVEHMSVAEDNKDGDHHDMLVDGLAAALQNLPEDQRQIIQLRFLEELSPGGNWTTLKP